MARTTFLEPYEEAERREREWDTRCVAAPRCSKCNGSVYPYETYASWEGIILCERCKDRILARFEGFISRHTYFTDELEI